MLSNSDYFRGHHVVVVLFVLRGCYYGPTGPPGHIRHPRPHLRAHSALPAAPPGTSGAPPAPPSAPPAAIRRELPSIFLKIY